MVSHERSWSQLSTFGPYFVENLTKWTFETVVILIHFATRQSPVLLRLQMASLGLSRRASARTAVLFLRGGSSRAPSGLLRVRSAGRASLAPAGMLTALTRHQANAAARSLSSRPGSRGGSVGKVFHHWDPVIDAKIAAIRRKEVEIRLYGAPKREVPADSLFTV